MSRSAADASKAQPRNALTLSSDSRTDCPRKAITASSAAIRATATATLGRLMIARNHEILSRAGIDDSATPNVTPRRELISHEVDAPGIVRLLRRCARDGEPLPMPSPHGQSFEGIQAFDASVIHVPAVVLQLPVQARHAPPRVRGREGSEFRGQPRRALEAEHPARARPLTG